MKNVLFGLIAIVVFVFNANAQEKSDVNQKADFKKNKSDCGCSLRGYCL